MTTKPKTKSKKPTLISYLFIPVDDSVVMNEGEMGFTIWWDMLIYLDLTKKELKEITTMGNLELFFKKYQEQYTWFPEFTYENVVYCEFMCWEDYDSILEGNYDILTHISDLTNKSKASELRKVMMERCGEEFMYEVFPDIDKWIDETKPQE